MVNVIDLAGALEQYVDDYTLETVLSVLAEVCLDKAEHIRTNWQDEVLAQVWDGYAGGIEHVIDRMDA